MSNVDPIRSNVSNFGQVRQALQQVQKHFEASAYVAITGATSTGSITNEVYTSNTIPANKVLESFTCDSDNVTLSLEIHEDRKGWQPEAVTVSGGGSTPVSSTKDAWTQVGSGKIWTTTVTLTDADTTGELVVTSSGGYTTQVIYTRDQDPPDVLTAIITTHPLTTGGDSKLQYDQTSTSSATGTQYVYVSGTCDAHATRLWANNYEVSNSEQGPYVISGGTFTDIAVAVRSTGGAGTGKRVQLQCAVGVSGTVGNQLETSAGTSVEVNHTAPNPALSSITYPATQFAISDDENAQVTVTDSNAAAGDTFLWIAYPATTDFVDTGNLAIGSSSANVDAGTYDATSWDGGIKWVERQAQGYRDGSSAIPYNLRLTITRSGTNGLDNDLDILVKIAHDAPTMDHNLTSPLMSRASPDPKTYGFILTADQELQDTPTVARDGTDDGTALPALSGSEPDKTWTATMSIYEADTKNVAGASYTWASILGTNGANKTVSALDTTTYQVAGFETRSFTVSQFTNKQAIGTMVSNRDNANKLVLNYAVGAGVYVDAWDNSTEYPNSQKYTIVDNTSGNFDADGNAIRCLDPSIYNGTNWYVDIREDA